MNRLPLRALALLVLTLSFGSGCATPGAGTDEVGAAAPRRIWQPDGPAKAVVLALHGFNDYSQAFDGFATFAARRDTAVLAYDQQGFGARPEAGTWPGTDRLVADVRAELERLRRVYPRLPIYLLGESMGGAIAIRAAIGQPRLPIDGLALVAPAVWGGDEFNLLYRVTLWTMARLMPGLELTGQGLDIWPSDNIDMLRSFSADPLVVKATRIDAIEGLVNLMDGALAGASRLDRKLLVLTGRKDEVVPAGAFEALRARLETKDCTAITYPDGYHMLLRDLQRIVVWEDILAWIDGRTPPSRLQQPCRPEGARIPGSLARDSDRGHFDQDHEDQPSS